MNWNQFFIIVVVRKYLNIAGFGFKFNQFLILAKYIENL